MIWEEGIVSMAVKSCHQLTCKGAEDSVSIYARKVDGERGNLGIVETKSGA